VIMKQILSAVNYMHKKNIMHRDLKPENIVLEYRPMKETIKDPPIKIIDFGTATTFQPGKYLKDQVGSPYYVAPDVLEGRYNEKCDMWSCGIILYTLLCGSPPFRGKTLN
jgi:calcium-dependent protein kinase